MQYAPYLEIGNVGVLLDRIVFVFLDPAIAKIIAQFSQELHSFSPVTGADDRICVLYRNPPIEEIIDIEVIIT